jgi:hypothetical protein
MRRMIISLMFLMLVSLASFAQNPAYTQSVSFACNQEVCNGLPLDQGGTWQFIIIVDSAQIYIDSVQ